MDDSDARGDAAWTLARESAGGWISARSAPTLLVVGAAWVGLTVVHEFILGRVVFHQTWADIASDFDLLHGRLLPIGLLFSLFALLLAARLRGRIGRAYCKKES